MPSAVVVGAGIFGVCTADALAGAGWRVTLLEQAWPGHVRSTSSGDSRILRSAHGANEWYARSAQRARKRWLALNEEVGEPLYHETGACWLAQRDGGNETESERTLNALGIPCSRVAPADARDLLPGLSTEGLAFVLHEPEAGFVRARRAVQVLAARAVRERGVVAEFDTVGTPAADGTVDGHGADVVVWACGPWLGRLFPGVVPMRVFRRDYAYLGGGSAWRTPPAPPWVDYDAAVYGLGDLDGVGTKVAWDGGTVPFDPDTDRRDVDPIAEQTLRAYLAIRFPALAQAPLLGWRTCQYELTDDTEFIIARHPANPSVWLLGGGSGHGFKHGPAIGELMHDLITSGADPDPRFGLHARTPAGSLITGGVVTRGQVS